MSCTRQTVPCDTTTHVHRMISECMYVCIRICIYWTVLSLHHSHVWCKRYVDDGPSIGLQGNCGQSFQESLAWSSRLFINPFEHYRWSFLSRCVPVCVCALEDENITSLIECGVKSKQTPPVNTG